ncbi:MAG: hypothetical protein ABIR37_00335, partial [Candidatus Saccharimonadales bacterium]
MQPQDSTQPQNNDNQPQPGTDTPQAEQQPQPQPQQMYYTRPLEPVQPVMSDEVRQKHEASKRKYPKLNLSEGEYV